MSVSEGSVCMVFPERTDTETEPEKSTRQRSASRGRDTRTGPSTKVTMEVGHGFRRVVQLVHQT